MGCPGPLGILRPDRATKQNLGHRAIFCYFRGRTCPGSRKRLVFLQSGAKVDSSDIICINKYQRIKEMMTDQQQTQT